MSPRTLFAVQVLFLASIPFAFAFLARPLHLLMSYVYIAVVLVLGGFMGAVFGVPLTPRVTVSEGSILYGALILSSLLIVVIGRDTRVVRNIVKIVIAVNIFKIAFFAVAAAALRDSAFRNPFKTSASVFEVGIQVVLTGGVLIVAELLLLIVVFEQVKRRVRNTTVLALTYVVFFIGVLLLDGLLFPLLAGVGGPDLATAIATGVRVKLAIALAYSVPLLVFLAVFRRTFAAYLSTPIRVQELFLAPREDLVRELERQQEALEIESQRYQWLVESTGDAVIGVGPDGRVSSWNSAADALFAQSAADVVGRPVAQILGSGTRELRELLVAAPQVTAPRSLETSVRRPDGGSVEVALTVSPVRDAHGATVGGSLIGRDISERRRMQRALTHQAMHDHLTGLPNRALLIDRLEHALKSGERLGAPVAVLFLDLDQFKMVNDGSGHQVGDKVLVAVAQRLSTLVRPQDTVARFGGDEFVLLCEDTDETEARAVAARVLAALAESFDIDGQRVYASASVGIALAPPRSAEALLRYADTAMYVAKARGRGRAEMFDASVASHAENRLEMAGDLRDALSAESLELHYQPVVDLRTGQMIAMEALARWRHPERGAVPPDVFIALAEETGIITTLDRWAVQRAVVDGARLFAAGLLPDDGRIAVNVSARDLSSAAIEEMLTHALQGTGDSFSFSRLVIEVTETGVLSDLEHTSSVLQELRSLGVAIAIDDFGTGYSSLTYLRRLPVDQVKIDRSFISGIVEHADDLAIVTSVVQLAHAIGLTTVAEGVESLEQCRLLREIGCDVAQGFLWSPAVPPAAVGALLESLPGRRFSV